MGVPIFWVEQVPDKHRWTYSCREAGPCPANGGGEHRAERVFAPGEKPEGDMSTLCPKVCACGHVFGTSLGIRSGRGSSFWRRLDNGQEIENPLPVGACYVAEPMKERDGWEYKGADGLNVVCVTPGGHWYIDSRASNCTMKNDIAHRCWVRHGTVGGKLHVDKNGPTCAAGAGSILMGDFHGFLHNGEIG